MIAIKPPLTGCPVNRGEFDQALQVLMMLTVIRPSVMNAPPMICACTDWIAKKIDKPPTMSIEVMAISLTRQLIHRCCSQLRIIGPNVSFSSIQRCHFSEDRAKHAVANNTKGVVGSSGKNTPITAIPRKTKPNNRNTFILDQAPGSKEVAL